MTDLTPRTRALIERVEAVLPSQHTPEFERIDERLLSVQVCTSLTDAEATERVNCIPAGTSYGRHLSTDPACAPVPCDDRPDTHRHLIFEC